MKQFNKEVIIKLKTILTNSFNKLSLENSFNKTSKEYIKNNYNLKCFDINCLLTYSSELFLINHIVEYPHNYAIWWENQILNKTINSNELIKIRCPICYKIFEYIDLKTFINNYKFHCKNNNKNKHFLNSFEKIIKIFSNKKKEENNLNIKNLLLNPINYLNKIKTEYKITENSIFEILFFIQIISNSFKGLYLYLLEDNKYICRFAGCYRIFKSTEAIKYHLFNFSHSFYELFFQELNKLESINLKLNIYNFELKDFINKINKNFNLIKKEDYLLYKNRIINNNKILNTNKDIYNYFKEVCKSIFNLKNSFYIYNIFIYVGNKTDLKFPILMDFNLIEIKKSININKSYFINKINRIIKK